MKISERTIKRLGEMITGDKALSPYRSGPKLVSFFNDFGTNHAYGQGFPSRWTFAEDCLRGFNDTTALRTENPGINNSLKQTLTGFISIICGLSGLSNKMGDRHVREYKPAEHHAALIVNAAMTFSNFIFDTYAYQRGQKPTQG